jgi:parvulin-like peptidyl-prolyl isomerase
VRHVPAQLAIGVLFALEVCACLAQPPLHYPLPGVQPSPPMAQPFAGPAQVAAFAPAPPPQAVIFQPGEIVARVGDKTILYGDVAPTVNMILEPALAKAKGAADRDAIESQRPALTKHFVQRAVQNKMLLIEFERGMPSEMRSDPTKRAEAEGKLRKSVRNSFDAALKTARDKVANASADDIDQLIEQDPTMIRLALIMKERGLQTQGELDVALRQYGTTLEQQVKNYGEHMMGTEAARGALGLSGKIQRKYEVTHEEMLDYFQQHQADYRIPAKARFEILTARFSRFGGDRQAARDHAAMMGNEVLLGGTPFAAVARKHSHEPNAADGGYYDWIAPGTLASKPIDQAVFTLEVDKLSQIIEDDLGCHILRVRERRAAGVVSFAEAQPEIRKKIEAQKRSAEQQKYFNELRERTVIWTIYDERK